MVTMKTHLCEPWPYLQVSDILKVRDSQRALLPGEKTASALDGDALHGISLCLHPNNSSMCTTPPVSHSQVGVRIQSILQTAYTILLSLVREGSGPAAARKSFCREFTGVTPCMPQGRLYPIPHPITSQNKACI